MVFWRNSEDWRNTYLARLNKGIRKPVRVSNNCWNERMRVCRAKERSLPSKPRGRRLTRYFTPAAPDRPREKRHKWRITLNARSGITLLHPLHIATRVCRLRVAQKPLRRNRPIAPEFMPLCIRLFARALCFTAATVAIAVCPCRRYRMPVMRNFFAFSLV